jgi:hypothetical protein
MAKPSQMNNVEEHLEKGLLGLCALGLVFAAFYWVLSSPRSVSVEPDSRVSPAKVDEVLLETARRTQARIEEFSPDPNMRQTPDYKAEFVRLRTEPWQQQKTPWNFYAGFQPLITDQPIAEGAKVKLVDVIDAIPNPDKPIVKAEPELPDRPMDNPADVMTAHVVSVLPLGQLQEAWRSKLKDVGLPFSPIVLGIHAEAQEQLPDGQWGPPREVQAVTMPLIDSQNSPIAVPVIPNYDGSNAVAIDEMRRLVSDPSAGWQQFFLQPEYWQIWWPGYGWVDWRVNLPMTSVSEAAKTEQAAGALPGAAPMTPTPGMAPTVRPMGQASFTPRGGRPGQMREFVEEIEEPGPRQARQQRRDGEFVEGGMSPGGVMPGAPAQPEPIVPPEPTLVPPLAGQLLKGSVLVWFHDTSLESLKVYRYRLRVKLLNPLLAFANAVADPNDAAPSSLLSPYSDWSDPVFVPQVTEFFLVGSFPAQGSVRVAVFSRALGQQVKETFTVVQGQSIGQLKEIELAHPAQEGKVSKVPVDFSTSAIAVEFNFNKLLPTRRTAVEMVYLDERGQLRTMVDVRALSKTNPEYKHYADLEEKTKVSRRAAGAAAEAAAAAAAATKPAVNPVGRRGNFDLR